MAICASCGAASAEGARGCASCGRPLVPPPPLPPTTAPTVAPPVAPPVGPPPGSPPAVGSWGSGTVLEPGGAQPAALRWLTGADWRPALRAVVAPTAVLLLAALLAAVPSSYGGAYAAPFGSRFGAALAAALASLGAPFKVQQSQALGSGPDVTFDYVLRIVPMTVTALWLLALWLGLRAGLRRRQAPAGEQLTTRQALDEAARTALVAAAVTLLLGAVSGARWMPGPDEVSAADYAWGFYSASGFSPEAGWLEAVGWTFLFAGLVALAVHGTDALRWAAWRSATVRGWAVAGLTAGRVLAGVVGIAALAAFVVVAAQGEGGMTWTALAFLPNLGLLLLGFGSGATAEAGQRTDRAPSYLSGDTSTGAQASFFDLNEFTGDWRWAGLLAVAAALLLGWTAFRRRLDAVDRIRLAVVYAVALSLLMQLAGAGLTTGTPAAEGTGGARLGGGYTTHSSVGLAFATVALANLVWAAIGALAVPPLLAAVLGGRPPVADGPDVPPQASYGDGLPASAADAPGAVVPAATDVLDSYGGGPYGGGSRGPAAQAGPGAPGGPAAGEDSSVWRRPDPTDG